MKLIIVESPTKARTFNKFLGGKEYQVEATMGHIRDLPENKISVDEKNKFKPDYIISPKKADTVSRIKSLAKKADTIILATDADREGEAISYHIAYLLGFIDEKWPKATIKNSKKLKRIVFHEITKSALEEALKNPSELNLQLVDAQQARRILDRIVGYKLSPLLWKKIGKRWLSAGRVQTVALRFIVEREKEIEKFASEPFYKVNGIFTPDKKEEIEAKLISFKDTPYEKKFTIELFDGKYTYSKTTISADQIAQIKSDLQTDTFIVADITENISKRTPPPPFITSTLQQEASHKLGYSSKLTMKLAQNLYERGLITYHRTDSVTVSPKFLEEAKKYVEKTYGAHYVPETERVYSSKSKLAQEAHEAIRPTHMNPTIEQSTELTSSHKKLYELIFKRAIATQMSDAQIKNVKIKILSKKTYLFESSYEKIMFDGFLVLYGLKKEDKSHSIKIKDSVSLKDLLFEESATQPPPRYNEASLIKTLEARGIGRPSTYAPTISTIQDRLYVEKKEARFYPTILGTAVCDYLKKAFDEFFEIDFTSNLEDDLDMIAHGKRKLVDVLTEFNTPLQKELVKAQKDKGHIDVQEKTDEKCPRCGKNLVIRFSKFGKFLACSGYPKCKFTKPFLEVIAQKCPKCGGDIVVRFTKKKKKFYGCANYPQCDFAAWKLNQITAQKPDQIASPDALRPSGSQ